MIDDFAYSEIEEMINLTCSIIEVIIADKKVTRLSDITVTLTMTVQRSLRS